MSQQMGSQPLGVLSDESQRASGEDAREMNLSAAKAVAEAVRTTLGPLGMDKMLVDSMGEVVVTNDGVTLLSEMDIDHPAADMVVEVAQTQEEEVGDGTTSAVVLAGELLGGVEDLLDRGVHPTSIVQGYAQAAAEAQNVLEEMAIDIDADDREYLKRIAETAITGKGAEQAKEHIAEMVVNAVQAATREDGTVDLDLINTTTFTGGRIADSRFVDGALVDRSPVHESMPTELEDANVLIYGGALELSELNTDAEANIHDPSQLEDFIKRDESELDSMVQTVIDSGADVLLTDGAIEDRLQGKLAEAGIMAMRRAPDDERALLARATGANRVSDLDNLSEEDLGYAGHVKQEKIRVYGGSRNAATERTTVFSDVAGGESASFILRGGTEHVLDELERAIEDSLNVVSAAIEDGKVVPGGGAPEMELALHLRDFADGVEGREQLAVEAFAEAVEVIPRTLAENAGHDPIDALVDLRATHDAGNTSDGLDANTGEVVDMTEDGVVEPLRVKTQAVESATEAASMLLRIDDIIAAGDLSTGGDDEEEGGPGGAPGGMGGMGGAM